MKRTLLTFAIVIMISCSILCQGSAEADRVLVGYWTHSADILHVNQDNTWDINADNYFFFSGHYDYDVNRQTIHLYLDRFAVTSDRDKSDATNEVEIYLVAWGLSSYIHTDRCFMSGEIMKDASGKYDIMKLTYLFDDSQSSAYYLYAGNLSSPPTPAPTSTPTPAPTVAPTPSPTPIPVTQAMTDIAGRYEGYTESGAKASLELRKNGTALYSYKVTGPSPIGTYTFEGAYSVDGTRLILTNTSSGNTIKGVIEGDYIRIDWSTLKKVSK